MKDLEKKKENYQVRVSTRLRGKTKDAFINDCIDREECESKLLREIIQNYYANKSTNTRHIY